MVVTRSQKCPDIICRGYFLTIRGVGENKSTHKSLYRFRPSSKEVIPYSCGGTLAFACKIQERVQPPARWPSPGLYRVRKYVSAFYPFFLLVQFFSFETEAKD